MQDKHLEGVEILTYLRGANISLRRQLFLKSSGADETVLLLALVSSLWLSSLMTFFVLLNSNVMLHLAHV